MLHFQKLPDMYVLLSLITTDELNLFFFLFFCKQFDPLELVSKKPHTVVLMLDSPEEHVLQSACEALYKFAEKCK